MAAKYETHEAIILVWPCNGNGVKREYVGAFRTIAQAKRAANAALRSYPPDMRGGYDIQNSGVEGVPIK